MLYNLFNFSHSNVLLMEFQCGFICISLMISYVKHQITSWVKCPDLLPILGGFFVYLFSNFESSLLIYIVWIQIFLRYDLQIFFPSLLLTFTFVFQRIEMLTFYEIYLLICSFIDCVFSVAH
jgi:hypothetical protein